MARSGILRARAVAVVSAALALPASLAVQAEVADASARVAIGAHIPEFSWPSPPRDDAIDDFAHDVGDQPIIVSTYEQWDRPAVDRDELDAIWERGAVPMVTWEPFTFDGARFPLSEIAAGAYDTYIAESARAAAAWGRPILLRFAHEMNGSWYPWGARVGGNTPRKYRRAWRHVVAVFRAQGADQVKWVWAPQVNRDGRYPFKRFYPGDDWVDWVGLDGYNSGLLSDNPALSSAWRPFDAVFGTSYGTLTRFSRRPVLITETGTSEGSGAKPWWVLDALQEEVPRYPRIRAVVWFNHEFDGNDFRIASSRESLRAFRAGIAVPEYSATTRDDLLATPATFSKRRR